MSPGKPWCWVPWQHVMEGWDGRMVTAKPRASPPGEGIGTSAYPPPLPLAAFALPGAQTHRGLRDPSDHICQDAELLQP